MKNYDLYDGVPPHNETDTSFLAAVGIVDAVNTYQQKVLEVIQDAGVEGVTDVEIELILDLNPQTLRPRRRELVLKGLVRDSGRRRRNPTTGRRAIVWIESPTVSP